MKKIINENDMSMVTGGAAKVRTWIGYCPDCKRIVRFLYCDDDIHAKCPICGNQYRLDYLKALYKAYKNNDLINYYNYYD